MKRAKSITRKFNYTGRKRIARSRIDISLSPYGAGQYSFTPRLTLDGLGLPARADIFIEAYRGASYMRVPCGTVQKPDMPFETPLKDIEPGSLPLFRVKVVWAGRIVAGADKIRPSSPDDTMRNRLSILPVEERDLGESVWRLDISDDGPILGLNSRISGIREIARADNAFLSFVYPEVVRKVLTEVVVARDYTDAEADEEDWESKWLRFAQGLPGVRVPPSGASEAARIEKEDWVEAVVEAFSARIRARDKCIHFIEGR